MERKGRADWACGGRARRSQSRGLGERKARARCWECSASARADAALTYLADDVRATGECSMVLSIDEIFLQLERAWGDTRARAAVADASVVAGERVRVYVCVSGWAMSIACALGVGPATRLSHWRAPLPALSLHCSPDRQRWRDTHTAAARPVPVPVPSEDPPDARGLPPTQSPPQSLSFAGALHACLCPALPTHTHPATPVFPLLTAAVFPAPPQQLPPHPRPCTHPRGRTIDGGLVRLSRMS